ncbi:hypothetical protein V8J88_11460 [Massilia sp. W12]|uniref:B12-binding domain-containing radical SAM protein n=1 Tax=Massilia sp. W12 TaxID=3126507 RepID=UPI0030CAC079
MLFLNLSNLPGRPVFPYAFVQVSALARRAGLKVVRWDGLDLSLADKLDCIAHLIRRHRPRAVGFTVRQADSVAADNYLSIQRQPPKNPWFPVEETRAAIAHVRSLCDAKIIVGGFNFSVNGSKAADYLQPDYGVVGEPDDFLQKFDAVLAGQTGGVANLLYRDENGVWRQNQRVYYGPLDEVEYTPDIIDEIFRFHGERNLRNAHLEAVPGLGSYKDTGLSIAIEIARGCPCSCSFCCEPIVKGKTVRRRNLDVVEAEMRQLLAYGLRYFWFICSELNTCKKHVMELAQRIINMNAQLQRPIFWRAYFLPGVFDKDELRILRRSGLLIEQSGAFTTLDDGNLARMREPYRVKNAVQQIKDFMEIDQEPEFEHMRQPRWILWSWLGNPYADFTSIRQTLELFVQEGLDVRYDEADSYPALRVYECLQHLPPNARSDALTVTGAPHAEPGLIHPSYYYNAQFVRHFGSIDQVHAFMQYASETFLSRQYRLKLHWTALAQSLGAQQLSLLAAGAREYDWAALELPAWSLHPDMGQAAPHLHSLRAQHLAQYTLAQWQDFLLQPPSAGSAEDAALGMLLHAAYVAQRAILSSALARYGIVCDAQDWAPQSPYPVLLQMMRVAEQESQLYPLLARDCSALEYVLLRYYLHALHIKPCPSLGFLLPRQCAKVA